MMLVYSIYNGRKVCSVACGQCSSGLHVCHFSSHSKRCTPFGIAIVMFHRVPACMGGLLISYAMVC